jgi:hypothetical protein
MLRATTDGATSRAKRGEYREGGPSRRRSSHGGATAGVALRGRPKRKFRVFGQARVSLRPASTLVKVGMLGGVSVDFAIALTDLVRRKR